MGEPSAFARAMADFGRLARRGRLACREITPARKPKRMGSRWSRACWIAGSFVGLRERTIPSMTSIQTTGELHR